MITAVSGALHFFVDFTCAWAMFGSFSGNYEYFLVYNFCAFALQMPIGTLMDLLRTVHRRLPSICTAVGVLLTAAGALLHPSVLGLGNAIFHVGGGIDVIESDFAHGRKGRELGVFVAPGALGLYAGTLLGRENSNLLILGLLAAVMLSLTLLLFRQKQPCFCRSTEKKTENTFTLVTLCFLVVVLRSWIGMTVTFPWKSIPEFASISVVAAALGKLCGGFFAAQFGIRRTVIASLILAAACYLLGNIPLFGLGAVLFFNMTMPITLYLLARRMKYLPGFAFGILTFGLFLGFLPVYARAGLPIPGNLLGASGSILSMVLLIFAVKAAAYDEISA